VTLDQGIVDALRKSMQQLRDVYAVVVDTDGEILSGRHRDAAGWTNRTVVDTAKLAETKGVPRAVMKEIVRTALNVQRKPAKEETQESLTRAARAFADAGVPRGDMANMLSEYFPYSRDYIRGLLPPDFKDEAKAEAGGRGRTKQLDGAQMETGRSEPHSPKGAQHGGLVPQRKEPYSRGVSPAASSFAVKTFKEPAVRFAGFLKEAGVKDVELEAEFPREGELTQDGRPKFYSADIAARAAMVVVEVEGEGSASKDNPERDDFFARQGYIVVHASNQLVRDYGPEVAELIAPLINDRVGGNGVAR
jgi:hypothetical protein